MISNTRKAKLTHLSFYYIYFYTFIQFDATVNITNMRNAYIKQSRVQGQLVIMFKLE